MLFGSRPDPSRTQKISHFGLPIRATFTPIPTYISPLAHAYFANVNSTSLSGKHRGWAIIDCRCCLDDDDGDDNSNNRTNNDN